MLAEAVAGRWDTSNTADCSAEGPRGAEHHHRRCLLTHVLPSIVLRVDPAGSCKPLKSEQGCELDDSSKLQPTSSDGCLGRIMPGAPTKQHRNPTARRRSGVAE